MIQYQKIFKPPLLLILYQKVMRIVEDFAETARDFAEKARAATTSAVAIQNAFKAVEYALSAYARAHGKRVPEAHYQVEKPSTPAFERLRAQVHRTF